jgi:hypothetical protein
MLGGSPAAGKRQVNVPLARNNDLPYVFLASADSVMHPFLGQRPSDLHSGAVRLRIFVSRFNRVRRLVSRVR